MALSAAMQWALANGMSEADVYQNINDFLASNPTAAQTQAQMAQYGISPEDVAAATKPSIQDQLKNQILSQGTTSQWQGEGKGSAEANAADMAKILADAGITDISQFGKVTKAVDVQVQPVYDYKEVDYGGETGVQLAPFVVGYTDQNGNAIDPSLVKTDTAFVGSGENANYETVYTAPIGKEEVFGNKLTGQAVTNTYGERQTGDAFGGTYTGKGNTAYNVQFDESGKPVFYTQGASSSDTKDIARIIQAGLLLSGAGGALGGALGLTGAAASGVGTGLISAGTSAIGGANLEDALKTGLLSGGLAYGAGALDNYLATGSIADPGITERQLAIADAKQLAAQGLPQSQIADILGSSGYNEVMVDSAIRAATKGLTSAALPTSTATDVVNVTGTATPAISTGGLLSSLVPTSTTTPAVTNAGTVNVTGSSTPQQVDQAVLDLVNSQLATNVATPANLANVQVTGTADKGMMSNADTTSAILNTIAGLPTTSATTPTNNLANVEVTAPTTNTGMMSSNNTANAILNALTGLPTTAAVTPTTTTPTVNVTAQTPVTTQDITTAVTSLLPTTTTATQTTAATTPTVTVTAPTTPVTNQDVATIVSSLVPTATPAQSAAIAEQVITSSNPKTPQEAVNAIVATLTPAVATPAATTPTVTVTASKTTPTLSDVVAPITAALPTVTPAPVTPEVVVTAPSTPKVADVVAPITAALPAVTTPATTTPTTDKTNELGLTDAQMLNLLKGGIGLLGGLGGAAALTNTGGTGMNPARLPTQLPPMYTDDYFTKVQQNYNRILPAVPRDVASPLRDWYLSQYGA